MKNKSLWRKIKKHLDFYLFLDIKSKIVTRWNFLILKCFENLMQPITYFALVVCIALA